MYELECSLGWNNNWIVLHTNATELKYLLEEYAFVCSIRLVVGT